MEKKRVRREDADWPEPHEIDRELAHRLYEGALPFKDWKPCRDIGQAVAIAQDLAWKRGWNFDLKWLSYVANVMFDSWEAHFTNFNFEATQRKDYDNALEEYWAKASKPAEAICRAILNVLDGVESDEYRVCPTHGVDGCPPQDDNEEDEEGDEDEEVEP